MTARRIVLCTGDGKGKTTAALGMAVRALGNGQQVLILGFVKGQETGEERFFAAQQGAVYVQTGLGFVPEESSPHFAAHRDAAQAALRRAEQELAGGAWDTVILDEICIAVARGLLDAAAVTAAVRGTHARTAVVLTGRGALPELIALADTVSEVRCVKHGYQAGIAAQPGIEW